MVGTGMNTHPVKAVTDAAVKYTFVDKDGACTV